MEVSSSFFSLFQDYSAIIPLLGIALLGTLIAKFFWQLLFVCLKSVFLLALVASVLLFGERYMKEQVVTEDAFVRKFAALFDYFNEGFDFSLGSFRVSYQPHESVAELGADATNESRVAYQRVSPEDRSNRY